MSNNKSQVLFFKCYNCGLKAPKKFLCSSCTNNPFLVEDARNMAAENNDKEIFKELYSKIYATIKNLNNQEFWDNHFKKELSLSDQDEMTKDKLDILLSFLPPHNIKLLDLGFGQGYFEELLFSKRNADLYGIDISSNAVTKAKKKFQGKFITGDVLEIKKNYNNEKFNTIVAIELIEHISPQKILSFFTDIYSLLKPGGILLLSTPINEHLDKMENNPSGHVRAYTPEVLKMELEVSGFRVEEMKTLHAFRKHYKLKKLLAKIFSKHWEPNNVVVKAVRV